LDDSQREAATAARGPLLLGAGPGTGKTRTLVARIKYLLETGVAPENILALTFSRKATAELRERIAKHLPQGSRPASPCVRFTRSVSTCSAGITARPICRHALFCYRRRKRSR
jgi:superfamily I DNA/RNA helicase